MIKLRQILKEYISTGQKFGKHISTLPDGVNVLFKDMQTDINVPVVLRYDNKNKEIDMISKTVMRKKNFKSSTKKYSVESRLVERIDYLHIATEIVKAYGLRSRVRFAGGKSMAQYKGLDPHDDNKWEERAERWALKQWPMIKKKFNL